MPLSEPVEKIVWSRPSDMPELEILSVENCRQLWCIYHQTYTICTPVELGGFSEWTYRRKDHRLYNQQLMLIEPGELHRTNKLTGAASFNVLCINPALVESLAREAGLSSRPHFKAAQATTPLLFHAFAQIHSVLAQASSLLERQSLLAAGLGRLLAEYSECGLRREAPHSRTALRRTRDHLHAHYAHNITLEELAGIAGLSRFHFLRMFAREFGLPPHAYQIRLQVEKSRDLLKAGVPIGKIEAGFADQSHLTRHFKRLMGVTPKQYASMAGPHRAASGRVARSPIPLIPFQSYA